MGKQHIISQNNKTRISKAIRAYFYRNGISFKEAGKRLGISGGCAYTTAFRGYFTEKNAKRWSVVFGFNEEFLMNGTGRLLGCVGNYDKISQERNELAAIESVQRIMLKGEAEETLEERKSRIIHTVRGYLKENKITYEKAATMLGYKSGEHLQANLRYGFTTSKKAKLWSEAFGFNEDFLLRGVGDLKEPKTGYRKVLNKNERLRIRVQRNTEKLKSLKKDL